MNMITYISSNFFASSSIVLFRNLGYDFCVEIILVWPKSALTTSSRIPLLSALTAKLWRANGSLDYLLDMMALSINKSPL